MTTATIFPTRTAAELKREADAFSAELQKLIDEQRAVPAKSAAAASVRDFGEWALQQQREKDLPGEIATAKKAADESRARYIEATNAEGSARLQQQRTHNRAALDQRKPKFHNTLVALARGAAEFRKDAVALQAVEEQLGQNPGPLRMELQTEAVFIEVFASKIAQWLRAGAQPDVQWHIIDQITGVEGAALRAARDAFFGK